MPLKINVINCPSCGAAIPIQEGTTQISCSYCGSKFAITNENEFVYRHVDEAKVRQVEIDRMIRLKELEMEEKKRKIGNIKIIAVAGAFLLLSLIAGIGRLIGDGGVTDFGLIGIGILIYFLIMYVMLKDSKKKPDEDTSTNQPLRTLVFKEELVPDHHFCGHCGAKLLEGAQFCHKCGHVVAKLPTPPRAGKQNRKFR